MTTSPIRRLENPCKTKLPAPQPFIDRPLIVLCLYSSALTKLQARDRVQIPSAAFSRHILIVSR